MACPSSMASERKPPELTPSTTFDNISVRNQWRSFLRDPVEVGSKVLTVERGVQFPLGPVHLSPIELSDPLRTYGYALIWSSGDEDADEQKP